jgi:hypothetical protein
MPRAYLPEYRNGAVKFIQWRDKPVADDLATSALCLPTWLSPADVRQARRANRVFGERQNASGLLVAMGSICDCPDNSVAESFFGTLQLELQDGQQWRPAGSSLSQSSPGSRRATTRVAGTLTAGC